jgi:hypothetical protein
LSCQNEAESHETFDDVTTFIRFCDMALSNSMSRQDVTFG